jgi:hypothetical protein
MNLQINYKHHKGEKALPRGLEGALKKTEAPTVKGITITALKNMISLGSGRNRVASANRFFCQLRRVVGV